jgi:hypothetical protein
MTEGSDGRSLMSIAVIIMVGLIAAAGVGSALAGAFADDPAPGASQPSVRQAPQAPSSRTQSAPAASQRPTVPDWCPAGQVRGSSLGGPDTAIGAIFALQHAYYVQRSGEAAAALLAGEGLPGAATIQQGIDTIPAGTEHCLGVTLSGPASAQVLVAQRTPDGEVTTFQQSLTLAQAWDGTWVITSLE